MLIANVQNVLSYRETLGEEILVISEITSFGQDNLTFAVYNRKACNACGNVYAENQTLYLRHANHSLVLR